jgi:hypothetical protein
MFLKFGIIHEQGTFPLSCLRLLILSLLAVSGQAIASICNHSFPLHDIRANNQFKPHRPVVYRRQTIGQIQIYDSLEQHLKRTNFFFFTLHLDKNSSRV